MTTTSKSHSIISAALAALLLAACVMLAGAFASKQGGGPFASSVAQAGGDDNDRGERRINRFRGSGLRAARVARRRVGGGRVRKVIADRDDRQRYEVTIRKGSFRYSVDISRRFRVLDVDRDRIGRDRDDRFDD